MRVALLCSGLVVALAGCNNGSSTGGSSTGVGLGGSCAEARCRDGLKCDDTSKTCVGKGDVADGEQCTIGADCASGQCAPNGLKGKCAAAGPGVLGTSCQGDGQCGAGLKCAFDGETLFPSCLKAGDKDLGAECTASRECVQGLLCASGKCAQPALNAAVAPNGYPPFFPSADSWQGGTCPAVTTGAVKALWVLPREDDGEDVKQDFYRLPFPNDAARDAAGKLDFSRHPKDPAPPFGFDALGRYLEVLATEPFGNYGTVTLRFDGQFDFASVNAGGANPQTRYVDLTTGPRFGGGRGLFYSISSGRNRYVCHNYMAVRPATAEILLPGTYAVILLKGVTAKGANVEPSADFVAMLQPAAPTDATQARAWPAYAPLRAYLTQKAIPITDVLTATVFTVGDPQTLMKKLAASVAAEPAPVADAWVKCGSGTPSPCSDSTGVRACGTSAAFDEWHTLVEIPIFQKGTAPYLTPAQGGDIDASAALITPVRREKVCAALVTPVGTPPANGWPLVVYGHGTGGNFRGHAGDGAGAGAAGVGFAVLGFDAVGHGPRRGTRTDMNPDNIVYNFGNPLSARGTNAQGGADLHSFTRLAKALAASTPAPLPKLDATHLSFWGHSQGATAGGLFLAHDRAMEGALFTGASASLIDALLSKKAPINIAGGMWLALSEASPSAVDEFHPVLSMLQNWIDPVDPIHFGRQLALVPDGANGVAHGRHVFMVWGKDDTYTARPVQNAFAIAAQLTFVGPNNDEFRTAPVASVSGNTTATIGGAPKKFTTAFRQYLPPTDTDGHFVVFNEPTAKTDAVKFLQRTVRGELPTIPEP
jgi:hypothetical protein